MAAEAFRHELKFMVAAHQYHVLRHRLRHLLKPDPHAGPSGEYRITSIYFDDVADTALYEKLAGMQHRQKIRTGSTAVDCPAAVSRAPRGRVGETACRKVGYRRAGCRRQVLSRTRRGSCRRWGWAPCFWWGPRPSCGEASLACSGWGAALIRELFPCRMQCLGGRKLQNTAKPASKCADSRKHAPDYWVLADVVTNSPPW